MIDSGTTRPASLEFDAGGIRRLLRQRQQAGDRDSVARLLRKRLRAYVDHHPKSSGLVNDAGMRSGVFWRVGNISEHERAARGVSSRSALVLASALVELAPVVDSFNSAICVALLDQRFADAEAIAVRGIDCLGADGYAAQLPQWLGVIRHLRQDHLRSIEALRTAAESDLGIVRRCSLVSCGFVADLIDDESTLGWSMDRLADESPRNVRHAVEVIAATRSRRDGYSAVHSALRRQARFAERSPHRRILVESLQR